MSDTQETPKAGTKTGWKKRAVHEGVTLPSGQVVDIRIPDLGKLIAGGVIPNELVQAAIQHRQAEETTPELLKEGWDYVKFIIPQMIVKPSDITAEDVEDLPVQDLELLAQFAGRQTDMDAVGHQLGGLETQKKFREVRGIFDIAEALGGGAGDQDADADAE